MYKLFLKRIYTLVVVVGAVDMLINLIYYEKSTKIEMKKLLINI
jgi:hypothetical protein